MVAQQVETFEEFVAAAQVAQEAFHMSEQDRQVFKERQADYWQWQRRYQDFETFAACVDGEIVGSASAIFRATPHT